MERRVRPGNPDLLFRDRVRSWTTAAALAVALAACGTADQTPTAIEGGEDETISAGWELTSDGPGARLVFTDGSGDPQIRLICSERGELRINVPAFRPIGSEERMTFGQGETVETFVADPAGDEELGGVTAEGPVPANFEVLISGRVAANYGAQNSGPHLAPPANLVSGFLGACSSPQSPPPARPPGEAGNGEARNVSACLVQDGRPIPEMRIRAVGTEPFWGANVEGRCVTYSTIEDQDGTRVWTQFSGSAESGIWRGALGGQTFVMRTRPQPGCSDGMSDIRYPVAVALTVMGEERRGCARSR
jgi:uncharacterized membrane protein